MKLSAFRTRILAGAVATTVLALLMVMFTVSTVLESQVPQGTVFSDAALRSCLADPEAWSSQAFGHHRLAAHAQAPPGVPALGVGQSYHDFERPHVTVVYHAADTGPCAWLVLHSGPPEEMAGILPTALALATFLAVLVVGGTTYTFTVMPLMRRIGRIREAAVGVGSERYASSNDAIGDALADIAGVLDGSHERILADRAELVRRHQALERYMAELAHDLRTPLGSLLLALQEVDATTPGGVLPPVRRAMQDAAYVSTLVENLHQATRLRHGLDPLEGQVDLGEVVRNLEVRFRALGRVEGVAVAASVPEGPVLVRCTPALAERAIGNLVHNGITHGGANVAVLLSVHGDTFELVVLDDGEGLPEPIRVDLAQRTFIDDPARGRGHGLGIAITNEVVQRAGWRVAYDRADEGGLRVIIEGAVVS